MRKMRITADESNKVKTVRNENSRRTSETVGDDATEDGTGDAARGAHRGAPGGGANPRQATGEPAGQGSHTRDGARRREDILLLARRLFLEHGYHVTTTRMIARDAGVSDALLYRYFPSKRDLFDAVIDEGLGHLDPYLQFGAPVLAGLQLRETLEAAAYTTAEIVRRDEEVFRLIIQEQKLLANDDRLPRIIEELLQHFARRIRHFISTGEARPCNAWVFARQFIGGIAMYDLFNSMFREPRAPDGGAGGRPDIDVYLHEVVAAAEQALQPKAER